MRPSARARQIAIAMASIVVLGAAVDTVIDAVRGWNLSDMDAYWNAALRLRAGEPLYVASYRVGAGELNPLARELPELRGPMSG